jgi:flagellin-like protein
MKGISPLIASVLLIAITMTLAAILASFVSSYTQEQLSTLSDCAAGSVVFSTADYPKWDTNNVVAVIEARYADLDSFTFELLLANDTIMFSGDTMGTSIPAGGAGTIRTGTLTVSESSIEKVRVSAGNCDEVKTAWTPLR